MNDDFGTDTETDIDTDVVDGGIGEASSDAESVSEDDSGISADESGQPVSSDADTGDVEPNIEPAGTARSNDSDDWFSQVASAAPIKIIALPAGVEEEEFYSEMEQRGCNVLKTSLGSYKVS